MSGHWRSSYSSSGVVDAPLAWPETGLGSRGPDHLDRGSSPSLSFNLDKVDQPGRRGVGQQFSAGGAREGASWVKPASDKAAMWPLLPMSGLFAVLGRWRQ